MLIFSHFWPFLDNIRSKRKRNGDCRPKMAKFWSFLAKMGQFLIFDKNAKHYFFTFMEPREKKSDEQKNSDFRLFWPKKANF